MPIITYKIWIHPYTISNSNKIQLIFVFNNNKIIHRNQNLIINLALREKKYMEMYKIMNMNLVMIKIKSEIQ